MNKLMILACVAAFSANAKTIQMPPACTTRQAVRYAGEVV